MTKARILVVEDDPKWRDFILGRYLKEEGYLTQTAADCQEAIKRLDQQPFDVVIVDIGLSEKDYTNTDGMAVLEEVAKRSRKTVTIVVSGRAAVDMDINAFRQFNTIALIDKDAFTRNEFLEIVRQAASMASCEVSMHHRIG